MHRLRLVFAGTIGICPQRHRVGRLPFRGIGLPLGRLYFPRRLALRILHVTPSYVPAWRYGGPIVSVHGLCRALVERGHHVSVFTTTADGDADLDVPVGVPRDVDGVQVTYFACDGLRRLFWASRLRRALTASVNSFDVVHAHACFLMPPTWAARTAAAAGVPYLFSPRGMLVRELIASRNPWIKRAWIRLFDQHSLRKAAFVHVTSERERTELLRVLPAIERFAIVANGVDWPARIEERRERAGDLRLLFLGRINWTKGLDLAIEALSAAPNARLQIVGNDEEGLRPNLDRLASLFGVGDRVEWRGPLYGPEKAAALADADALVMPSLSENFGNSALEAMAAGLPVITTPEVGASVLVRASAAGRVVERSAPALASAIREFIENPDLRGRCGRAGRDAAAMHSWIAKAAEMESYYELARSGEKSNAA
jgi:glycosyltransferase involved in cell wall biosynthesis